MVRVRTDQGFEGRRCVLFWPMQADRIGESNRQMCGHWRSGPSQANSEPQVRDARSCETQ
jgi:hypothetical protein